MRIFAFDQIDLPVAIVRLLGLLALDGEFDVAERLEVHKPCNAVLDGKERPFSSSMICDTSEDVIRYADVERSLGLTREDKNPVAEIYHPSHSRNMLP